MSTQKEDRKFQIEKLEDRIAPCASGCGLLGGLNVVANVHVGGVADVYASTTKNGLVAVVTTNLTGCGC